MWERTLGIAKALGPDGWVLVGGLMVQLHGFEREVAVRPTADVDLLADARRRPSTTTKLAGILEEMGTIAESGALNEGIAFRWDVGGVVVEIFGPDGLKNRAATIEGFETFSIPGGTQALRRAETVAVQLDESEPVPVNRPDLLGAILIKARIAARKRKKYESDRQDLVRLLTFVDNPRQLAEQSDLSRTEKGWLRRVKPEINPDDPQLSTLFNVGEVELARQAVDLLIA